MQEIKVTYQNQTINVSKGTLYYDVAKKLSGINIKSETIRNMYNIIDVIV